MHAVQLLKGFSADGFNFSGEIDTFGMIKVKNNFFLKASSL
jgi:hypothetical protein